MLHLIFQTLSSSPVLERISTGDDVVFFENALWRLLQNSQLPVALPQDCSLFVLADELSSRGINAEELITGIRIINYAELVALTVKNPSIQTWC